jgi:hypothetical protein
MFYKTPIVEVNEIPMVTNAESQTYRTKFFINNFVLDHHEYLTLKMNSLLICCKNKLYKYNVFYKWTNYREIYGPSVTLKRVRSKLLKSQPLSNIFYNSSSRFNTGSYVLPAINIEHYICKKFVAITMAILKTGKMIEGKVIINEKVLLQCFIFKFHLTTRLFIDSTLSNFEISKLIFRKSGIIFDFDDLKNFLTSNGALFNFLIYDLESLGIKTDLVFFIREEMIPSKIADNWKIEDFQEPLENKLFIELLSFSELNNKFLT